MNLCPVQVSYVLFDIRFHLVNLKTYYRERARLR